MAKRKDTRQWMKVPPATAEEACSHMFGMVLAIAKTYCPGDWDMQSEMMQEGFLGIVNSMTTYDQSKGVWSKWATTCAKSRIRHYFRDKCQMVRVTAYGLEHGHPRFKIVPISPEIVDVSSGDVERDAIRSLEWDDVVERAQLTPEEVDAVLAWAEAPDGVEPPVGVLKLKAAREAIDEECEST